MNAKRVLGLFWIAALVAAMAWLGKEGYKAAIEYEQASAASAQMMDAKRLARYKIKEFLSVLSFGMVKNDLKERLLDLEAKRSEARQRARRLILYFALFSLIALLSAFFMPIRMATGLLSIAALIALINGLITPILMVVVHKRLEYLGDVVLSFESKGILGSLEKLYHEGNWPIAGVILLFSVIIPSLKTLSLLFVSIYERRSFAAKIVRFFKHLGKWSMLDVFIVALLLVFLSSRGTDMSRAEAEIGIYFFLIYVILSTAASLAADKMLSRFVDERGKK